MSGCKVVNKVVKTWREPPRVISRVSVVIFAGRFHNTQTPELEDKRPVWMEAWDFS